VVRTPYIYMYEAQDRQGTRSEDLRRIFYQKKVNLATAAPWLKAPSRARSSGLIRYSNS